MNEFMVTNPLISFYTNQSVASSVCIKPHVSVVSFPDHHALWTKDGLEQLLQIFGPSVKCLFHSKRTFVVYPLLVKVYCNSYSDLIFTDKKFNNLRIENCEYLLLTIVILKPL